MDKGDIPFLSVTELSRLIATKELSPVEATEAYLERIDSLDFKFNAYLTVCRTEALQAAQAAERSILQARYLGPMHGIPYAVKDQLWTQGIRSTGGTRILADFIPDQDATVIAKLKAAGAVLLGKTNLSEYVSWRFQQRLRSRHCRLLVYDLARRGYWGLDPTPRVLVWSGGATTELGPGESIWVDVGGVVDGYDL